jgi:hypothetical protein
MQFGAVGLWGRLSGDKCLCRQTLGHERVNRVTFSPSRKFGSGCRVVPIGLVPLDDPTVRQPGLWLPRVGGGEEARTCIFSTPGTSAEAKNPVLWKLLKGIAHIQPVGIGEVVKATPRIAKWTGIKGNVRIQLILEKYAGKQKIGPE